jgi:ParB family chromosome partitioning protein
MPKETVTRLNDLSHGRGDLFRLDPRIIQVDGGWNVRTFDNPEVLAHVASLKDSIKKIGVQVPITVRYKEGRAILVDGECRLRATLAAIAEGADIATIPAVGEPQGRNEAERLALQTIRNSGLRFTPLENSAIVVRLQDYGWTQERIAETLGFSLGYIGHLLLLASSPESVKTMVADGSVSASLAIETVRAQGDGAAKTLGTALTEAKKAGKNKVTKGSAKKSAKRAGTYRYSQEDAKMMVGAFRDIYAKADPSMRKIRQICRDVLENFDLALEEEAE